MVVEGELTWGGEDKIEYTDDIFKNCIKTHNIINKCQHNTLGRLYLKIKCKIHTI